MGESTEDKIRSCSGQQLVSLCFYESQFTRCRSITGASAGRSDLKPVAACRKGNHGSAYCNVSCVHVVFCALLPQSKDAGIRALVMLDEQGGNHFYLNAL